MLLLERDDLLPEDDPELTDLDDDPLFPLPELLTVFAADLVSVLLANQFLPFTGSITTLSSSLA